MSRSSMMMRRVYRPLRKHNSSNLKEDVSRITIPFPIQQYICRKSYFCIISIEYYYDPSELVMKYDVAY